MSETQQRSDSQKRPREVIEIEKPRRKRLCNPPAPNLVGPCPIVTIKVRDGTTPESKWHTFQVHKNYLCHYSPYFRAALNGNFIESQEQEVKLEETDPTVFGMFVTWLYSQTIVNKSSEQPLSSHLFKLWVLADKLLVPRLQNDILTKLDQARKIKGLPSAMFGYIYENTTENSLLRKYIVGMCVAKTEQMKDPDDYPRELLLEIVCAARKVEKEAHRNGKRGLWRPDLEKFFVNEYPADAKSYRMGLMANLTQEESR